MIIDLYYKDIVLSQAESSLARNVVKDGKK
jgi:hypothetical protein